MKRIISRTNSVHTTWALLACVGSLASSTAANSAELFGDWETTQANAKLYREDRTVDYTNCSLQFRIAPKTRFDAAIEIEALSAHCQHPTYWDFSPLLAPISFATNTAGDLRLPSGKVGSYGRDFLDFKIDEDGTVTFLSAKVDDQGLSLEWSARSYEGETFDVLSGPMQAK